MLKNQITIASKNAKKAIKAIKFAIMPPIGPTFNFQLILLFHEFKISLKM